MKFSFKQFIVPNFWKRLGFMLPAMIMMGVFLSILIEIGYGTDSSSFTVLNISHITGLGLGPVQSIIFCTLFIFTFIFGSELIGLGTILNLFLIGYVADFCRWIWQKIGFVAFIQTCSLATTIIIFLISVLCFVFFVAIYVNSKMGIGAFDAIPQIISNHLPKVPFFIVRIIYDLSFFGIGIIVGVTSKDGIQGSVIGSIIMSLLLGPAISFVGKKLGKLIQ